MNRGQETEVGGLDTDAFHKELLMVMLYRWLTVNNHDRLARIRNDYRHRHSLDSSLSAVFREFLWLGVQDLSRVRMRYISTSDGSVL